MHLKVKRISAKTIKKYVVTFCKHLPTIIFYLVCLKLFYESISQLCHQYFRFNTNVLIRYESPEESVLPAITLCGCTDQMVYCWQELDALAEKANQIYRNYSVKKILEEHSFPENYLVASCYLVYDSRRPEERTPCKKIQPSIASLYDGRKCFTYFGMLDEHFRRHTVNYHQKAKLKHLMWDRLKSSEQYTWYIQLELNFTFQYDDDAYYNMIDEMKYYGFKLQDSSIIATLHSPYLMPTLLNSEFHSLEGQNLVTVHYSKQINRLLPYPYVTHCMKYSETKST